MKNFSYLYAFVLVSYILMFSSNVEGRFRGGGVFKGIKIRPKIKISPKLSGGGGGGGGGGSNVVYQQQPQQQQQFVFCGLNNAIWLRNQRVNFYIRPSDSLFTPGAVVNLLQPSIGFKPIQAPQNPLIPGVNVTLAESKKVLQNFNVLGVIQSTFTGYGCVNGVPADINQWFKVEMNVPPVLTNGYYTVNAQVSLSIAGNPAITFQGSSPTAVTING